MALPTWYSAGLVSVESGSTTVTVTGAYWGTGDEDDNIMVGDRFIVPGQPLIPAIPIAAVNGDEIELLWPWPGVDVAGQPYVIEYVGIIERSTRANRKALERMADISAWFDQIVADDASRLALETPSNPLVANRRILVRADGVIWAKKTSAYGDWEGPVAFRGDIGQKGWSPVHGIVADGARRVWQLVDWVGGEGVKPAGVGKYVGVTGLVDDIGDGINVRGPAGDLSGVTPFWQGRITVDADASAARLGLGAVGGPASSTAKRLSVFADASGKQLAEASGLTVAEQKQARADIGAALKGHLHGFTVSNNAANPTTHVDIAPGEAASNAANPVLMVLSSVLTKRLDSTWAPGSGNGGRDAGDSLANATYHVHPIMNLTTGDIDAVLSSNPIAPHVMPSGYTHSRRIWSIIRSAGAIMPFFQNGDHCVMDATTIEYNSGSARALSALALAGVPAGIVVRPILTMRNLMSSAGDVISYVAVNASSVVQLVARTQAAGGSDDNTFDFLATNTNREIFFQVSVLSGAASVVLNSKGWIDNRGRLG